MTSKIITLNNTELNIVSGGGTPITPTMITGVLLNSGVAYVTMMLTNDLNEYFCPTNTEWVKSCKVAKEISGMLAFSVLGLELLVGSALETQPKARKKTR